MKRYDLIAADSAPIPKIYSIGFSADPKVTRFGPTVRKQYIIHYVLSGKGSFNGNKVEKGQGFLISPGKCEEYHSDKTDPWSFLWIISEDPSMQHFFACHFANEKTSIFNFHNLYELELIAKRLASKTSGLSTTAQLSELFLHIFNACVVRDTALQGSITKVYFNFAMNYIKTNLHLPITVGNLCNAIGVTQPYLYKIFKQEIDQSPKEYISTCKIAEAQKLLVRTDLSISQIANSVGYENVLDFSKFFSKQTGSSPTAYRAAFYQA